jgi:2-polyprenyl-3-methyl-5-hydroxy-6-metoxy-1,4-benzoquinol methylase
MDLSERQIDEDNKNNKKFIQDATKVPWDIKDKEYDCVVALQVFEHLGTQQSRVFREIQRVSKYSILSFPYLWKTEPDNCHYMIDKNKIAKWTNFYNPEKIIEFKIKNKESRLAYIFKF